MRPELRLTITKSFTRTKKFEQSMCSHLVDLVSNFTITGELQFQFHEPTCPCHIVNEISNPTSESSSKLNIFIMSENRIHIVNRRFSFFVSYGISMGMTDYGNNCCNDDIETSFDQLWCRRA